MKKLVLVTVVLALLSANAMAVLYDDFSNAAVSATKWIEHEIDNGKVYFDGEQPRVGSDAESWAANNPNHGMAFIDIESDWTTERARMDMATPITVTPGETITIKWDIRWAENVTWGINGGLALLEGSGSRNLPVTMVGGEPVQMGHASNPKGWTSGSAGRCFFWDWHHEGYQWDSRIWGWVHNEVDISTTGIQFRSTAPGKSWTWNHAGVTAGTYTPSFWIFSPNVESPNGNNGGSLGIDNVEVIPEPATLVLLAGGIALIRRKK